MVINTLKVELDELPETKWEVTTGTGDTTWTIEGESDTPPSKLWDHLQTWFKEKDGVSAILSYHQLITTHFIVDGTLESQLNSMQDLQSECTLNKFSFHIWQYTTLLLALPNISKFTS
jgi:hypothetical protein